MGPRGEGLSACRHYRCSTSKFRAQYASFRPYRWRLRPPQGIIPAYLKRRVPIKFTDAPLNPQFPHCQLSRSNSVGRNHLLRCPQKRHQGNPKAKTDGRCVVNKVTATNLCFHRPKDRQVLTAISLRGSPRRTAIRPTQDRRAQI